MPPQNTLTYASLCAQILQKPCFGSGSTNAQNGAAYQTVMGGNMDIELDRLYWAKECQWPSETPADALYFLANERGLERVVLIGTGGTLENELLHRDRLKHAWNLWAVSGSQQGHRDELAWCGLTTTQVLRRVDFSSPPPVGSQYVRAFATQVWSQFDILIRQPMPIQELLWGSGWLYGDGSTWGTTLTLPEIQQLRRLIRDHKSAHDTCTYFWLQFSTGPLWGTFLWGNGVLYGGSGPAVTGIVCGEESWFTRGFA